MIHSLRCAVVLSIRKIVELSYSIVRIDSDALFDICLSSFLPRARMRFFLRVSFDLCFIFLICLRVCIIL